MITYMSTYNTTLQMFFKLYISLHTVHFKLIDTLKISTVRSVISKSIFVLLMINSIITLHQHGSIILLD